MPEKKAKAVLPPFEGFTPETGDFFWELVFNNERTWFNAHKDQFERCLNTPFKALANETNELMQEAFPCHELEVHASRIYRDARRLYGKGPYKENLWFSIMKHQGDYNGPSFYFEISPRDWSYGMGFYCEKPAAMELFRKSIEANVPAFERLAADIAVLPELSIGGELYKRPKGDFGEIVNAWYNRKWVSVNCSNDFGGDLFKAELPLILADTYKKLMPMYEYLDAVYEQTR